MKLKTKFQDEDFELGEVVEGVIVECLGKHEEELRIIATAAKGGQHTFYYSSIKKFMADWEDAPEEPDLFYYIDADGHINSHLIDDGDFNNVKDGVVNLIAIGNWFETEEKAKKAEKKLEARERLRRKGFRFTGYNLMDGRITFTFDGDYYGDEEDRKIPISDDLYTIFGGKE